MGREISARLDDIIQIELDGSFTTSLVNKMASNTLQGSQKGTPTALFRALAAGLDFR